jgi:hypothetical protein
MRIINKLIKSYEYISLRNVSATKFISVSGILCIKHRYIWDQNNREIRDIWGSHGIEDFSVGLG